MSEILIVMVALISIVGETRLNDDQPIRNVIRGPELNPLVLSLFTGLGFDNNIVSTYNLPLSALSAYTRLISLPHTAPCSPFRFTSYRHPRADPSTSIITSPPVLPSPAVDNPPVHTATSSTDSAVHVNQSNQTERAASTAISSTSVRISLYPPCLSGREPPTH
jgi:hypothetical protein